MNIEWIEDKEDRFVTGFTNTILGKRIIAEVVSNKGEFKATIYIGIIPSENHHKSFKTKDEGKKWCEDFFNKRGDINE